MRMMSLDLGDRRVGVALSDETQTLASPFQTLVRKSFARLLEDIQRIAGEQQVEAIVIGFPRSLNGRIGPQARHIASEANRIRRQLKLPVLLWDESLTTVRAEELMAESRGRRSRGVGHREAVDAMAAAVILQEYLDSARSSGHTPPDGLPAPRETILRGPRHGEGEPQ